MGLREWIIKRLGGKLELGVTSRVIDEPGWGFDGFSKHDYDYGTVKNLYEDALTAWRKNPIAWRIIAITTDYVIGDNILLASPIARLDRFTSEFWNHPKNGMAMRLEQLSDELARSGDLFVVLFRNAADGMSYIRLVTKDRIVKIITAENDWENEIEYLELIDGVETKSWLSPNHPDSENQVAIMLHYSINKPAGALLGEGDLTTMLPWLQRYSRMLEDRVRLHWAIRSFLWVVTVPSNMIQSKREQYRNPPDTGSIIVKDPAEEWTAVTPDLKGVDARWDLQAVRNMIDAGSGYPPHWRGEAGDANLATATAMQGPTERHLLRRQQYFIYLLCDIVYQAYARAAEIGKVPKVKKDFSKIFNVVLPEISRFDNESLARASAQIAQAYSMLAKSLGGESETLLKLYAKAVGQFSGEPTSDEIASKMIEESRNSKRNNDGKTEDTSGINQPSK